MGVDASTLTSNVRSGSLPGTAESGGLNVTVVRGQEDTESILQKQIDKVCHERLSSPLPDLVMHSRSAELHAVHDPVHFIDNQTDDARLGPGNYFLHAVQGAVTKPLCVGDFLLFEPLIHPELRPQHRLLGCDLDAARKEEGRLPREGRLTRNRGDGRYPGKHRILPEAESRDLPRKLPSDNDPLIQGESVHQDQRHFILGIVELSGEKTRKVVEHDRRNRRQVDQSCVAFRKPRKQGLFDSSLQRLHPLACRFRQRYIRIDSKTDKLRPFRGAMEPVAVTGVLAGNGRGQNAQEAVYASLPIGIVVRSDSNGNPGLRQRFGLLMGNGFQKAFEEEVVDVDTNVIMVERQVRRAGKLKSKGSFMLANSLTILFCQPVKKKWANVPGEMRRTPPDPG